MRRKTKEDIIYNTIKPKLTEFYDSISEEFLEMIFKNYSELFSTYKINFKKPLPFDYKNDELNRSLSLKLEKWLEFNVGEDHINFINNLINRKMTVKENLFSDLIKEKVKDLYVFKNIIHWNKISSLNFFIRDISFIRAFKESLIWDILIDQKDLPWSEPFIEEFFSYLFYDLYGKGDYIAKFSHISTVPWSLKLINKYSKFWNWNSLSRNKGIPFNRKLLEKFKDKWDWKELSINQSIEWNIELLEEFSDRWNWKGSLNLSIRNDYGCTIHKISTYNNNPGLSSNLYIPWNKKLIKKFESRWDWDGLSLNPSINWNNKLLHEFKYKVNWFLLSWNNNLFVSLKDIQNFKEFFDEFTGPYLFSNESIQLNSNTLRQYRNFFLRKGKFRYGKEGEYIYDAPEYIKNPCIKWTLKEIQNVSKEFEWKSFEMAKLSNMSHSYEGAGEWLWFSRSKFLTKDILCEFSEFLDWETLSRNEFLPFNEDLVIRFSEKWNWSVLIKNKTFWKTIIQTNNSLMNINVLNALSERI